MSPTTSCFSGRKFGFRRSLLRVSAVVFRHHLVQDSRGVLVRQIDGHAGLQPCKAGKGKRLEEGQVGGGKALWQQNVGRQIEEAEIPRHHADHLARNRVDHNLASDDLLVAAEPPQPIRVRKDDGLGRPWRIVLDRKPAAQQGLNAQCRQSSLRDGNGVDLLGVAVAGHRRRTLCPHTELLECRRMLLPCRIEARPDPHVAGSLASQLAGVEDANQRFSFGVWQRTDEYCIHDTEDGRVGADAECEREDGGAAKTGIPADHSQRMASVSQQPFQESQRIHLIDVLADQGRAAELSARGITCRRGVHAARDELLCRDVQVELDFIALFGIGLVAAQKSPPVCKPIHDWLPCAGFRMRPMARTNSSQREVCAASCFLPSGVSR